MSVEKPKDDYERVSFEEAIDRAGFGAYSHCLTGLTGVIILSMACIGLGSTIIVPTSACELGTTTAQQGLLASGPVLGLMIGGLFWGYYSDTWGRRKMLLASLMSGAAVNTLASFSVNWIMLLIMQFFAGILTSGLYSMSMTLLSESVPKVKRNVVVLNVASMCLIHQGFLALMAIPIIPLTYSYHIPGLNIYFNSWRTLMLLYGIPAMVAAVCLFFMQESPKFVFAKGDKDQALEILRTIHRINNGCIAKEFPVKGFKAELEQVHTELSSCKDRILQLFKPPLLKYIIILLILWMSRQVSAFAMWLPTIAIQFMAVVDTGKGDNMTMCDIISDDNTGNNLEMEPGAVACSVNTMSMLLVLGVGVVQSIVNTLISFIVNRVGRRNLVIVTSAICGVSGILVNVVPNAIASAILFLVLMQGFVVQGLYTAITVALFPTQLRATAVALTMTGGRLSSTVSIQLLKMMLATNCHVTFSVFSAMFASSAITAMFLPAERSYMKPTPDKNKPNGEFTHL